MPLIGNGTHTESRGFVCDGTAFYGKELSFERGPIILRESSPKKLHCIGQVIYKVLPFQQNGNRRLDIAEIEGVVHFVF